MKFFVWAILGAAFGALIPANFFPLAISCAALELAFQAVKYRREAGEFWALPTLGIAYIPLFRAAYSFFFLGGLFLGYALR